MDGNIFFHCKNDVKVYIKYRKYQCR